MTAASPTIATPFSPLRFALRELRGGLHGFRIFVACIALGVMAIAGVGSFSRSLTDGIDREGQVILGGDLSFILIHGKVVLNPDMALDRALTQRDGAFGAAVDSTLLARLNLKPGARLTIGTATIEVAAVLQSEPDKLASGIGFGPRIIVSDAALRATGLLVPGSLVRWNYRLRLPDHSDSAVQAATAAAGREFPDAGWQIRNRTNASPQLERNVERFTQFLTLVGLTALLVGGVGVANAVKSHIDRKRDTIATLKALGATGGRVFAIYLSQVLVLSSIGALIGLVLGGALPFAIAAIFGAVIPLPIAPALQPEQLALAFGYGLMTALAFALWPLGRAHDVPVSALFRDAVAVDRRWPRRRYIVATLLVIAALVAVATMLSYDRKVALIFIGASAAVFVTLQGVALLVMAIARRLPRPRSTALRLAIANIHRPGALTPTVVLSLGLGLALLVTVIQIDGNLRRQIEGALPDKVPSFYFLEIQSTESDRFEAFVRQQAPDAALERVPMLRGRIMSAGGIKADDIKARSDASWVLQSDRGITFATEVPKGSTVVEGQWWPAYYKGTPLVSMEKKIAEGLNLKIGDPIVVNVLGRNIAAEIANLRSVNWENLGINFVLVFSPNAFAGAPHTDIATLSYKSGSTAEQETTLLKAVGDAFPAITTVRVKDAIEAVGNIVRNLILSVRGASLVALFAAVLVLGGALAAGHRDRIYDAVILKTLGATRGKLIGAYALEYLLLGSVTAFFGVAAGSAAAWLVVTKVMNLTYVWRKE